MATKIYPDAKASMADLKERGVRDGMTVDGGGASARAASPSTLDRRPARQRREGPDLHQQQRGGGRLGPGPAPPDPPDPQDDLQLRRARTPTFERQFFPASWRWSSTCGHAGTSVSGPARGRDPRLYTATACGHIGRGRQETCSMLRPSQGIGGRDGPRDAAPPVAPRHRPFPCGRGRRARLCPGRPASTPTCRWSRPAPPTPSATSSTARLPATST